jgi:hypothetical protein
MSSSRFTRKLFISFLEFSNWWISSLTVEFNISILFFEFALFLFVVLGVLTQLGFPASFMINVHAETVYAMSRGVSGILALEGGLRIKIA